MPIPIAILDYAGPEPATERAFLASCWAVSKLIITLIIFIAVVAVRGALLVTGFACLFAGILLLTLGGKRSAGRKLLEWRAHAADLTRLWLGDMVRPFHQWRDDRRRPAAQSVVTSS
jgi:hypothetical protein